MIKSNLKQKGNEVIHYNPCCGNWSLTEYYNVMLTAFYKAGYRIYFDNDNNRMMAVKHNKRIPLYRNWVVSLTGWNTVNLLGDKWSVYKRICQPYNLPHPTTRLFRFGIDNPTVCASYFKYPFVVKIRDGMGGRDCFPNVSNAKQLDQILGEIQRKGHKTVLFQKQLKGEDHRVLVIGRGKNMKIQSVVSRRPARVIGDGIHTIKELVVSENIERKQCGNHYKLVIDKWILQAKGYTPDTILSKHSVALIQNNVNIALGGSLNTTPLNQVHPDNNKMFLKTARMCQKVNQDQHAIWGFDYMTEDISKAYYNNGGAFNELNANPDLGMYVFGSPPKNDWRQFTDIINYLI